MPINQELFMFISLGMTLLLIILVVIQYVSLKNLKKSHKILFQGKQAKDLELIILEHQENLLSLNKQSKRLFELTTDLTTLTNIGLNKVGMVRFNPFKNLGGNQSFSVAFLNSHLNGLVISSLYSNEGSRFYAKTITEGESQKQYPLTEEEKQAISIAAGEK